MKNLRHHPLENFFSVLNILWSHVRLIRKQTLFSLCKLLELSYFQLFICILWNMQNYIILSNYINYYIWHPSSFLQKLLKSVSLYTFSLCIFFLSSPFYSSHTNLSLTSLFISTWKETYQSCLNKGIMTRLSL